jgi:hypothetical protein
MYVTKSEEGKKETRVEVREVICRKMGEKEAGNNTGREKYITQNWPYWNINNLFSHAQRIKKHCRLPENPPIIYDTTT